ncbi:hypothetical protein RB195_002470 [Necator americanus]|uniref:Uncharacterized protein n=1 Tax=Necator americanus TaxID=51031 RepID=A0ABR1DJZ1_NECAM
MEWLDLLPTIDMSFDNLIHHSLGYHHDRENVCSELREAAPKLHVVVHQCGFYDSGKLSYSHKTIFFPWNSRARLRRKTLHCAISAIPDSWKATCTYLFPHSRPLRCSKADSSLSLSQL